MLAACGGGGGGGDTATETPQDSGSSGNTSQGAGSGGDSTVQIEALSAASRSFNLQVDSQFFDAANIKNLTGGDLAAGWDLKSTNAALRPGMKVAFFGEAQGCDSAFIDGPVSAGADDAFVQAAQKTGVASVGTTAALRMTPQGVSGACDAANQDRTGPSWVYLNPSVSGAQVGMYTPSGPLADGSAPFLGAYGAKGADGNGSNAHITSTFVGFRMPWWATDAVRPWGDQAGVARVVSNQSLGSFQVVNDTTAQVKQQVVVSVINTACQAMRSSVLGPCQAQYLFNTAIMRSGVSNWESYAPSTEGKIWFDAVQGSTPIISGLIPKAGTTVSDGDTGLPLYSSRGGATAHAAFTSQNFDVRIEFPQLINAVRVIAAQRLNVSASALSDAQLASVWGTAWNDPSQWAFVAVSVGQEVYNAASDSRNVWIGGGFRSLYVGPQ